MTGRAQDRTLRLWAIAGLVMIGLIALTPDPLIDAWLVRPTSDVLVITARSLFCILVMVAVAGFYFRMFIECGFSRDVPRRGLWLTLFILLPLLSAYLYFFVTRRKLQVS